MSTAKLTLIGMYEYDDTLFANLTMPAGINVNDVINTLLLQGGEFEVLYPRPDFMKYAIGAWSVKWERTFAEWLRGTQASWNPIHNYDRIEDVRDEHRGTHAQKTEADYTDARTADLTDKRTADLQEQRTADLTDERTANLTDERTADLTDERTADLEDKTTFNNTDTTTQTTDGTTEHQVAAYDSSSYSNSSKDILNNGATELQHTGDVSVDTTGTDTMTHTGTDTMAHTGTDTMVHTGTDTMETTGTDTMTHTGTDNTRHAGTLSDVNGTDNSTDIHTAHMYGNIGVTTSAAMLKEFYDISKWNLYEHIADVFISELLIPVY